MDDLADKLSIDTPENIVLDAEIAGFGSRCVAAIIDYLYIFALMVCSTLLFTGALAGSRQAPANPAVFFGVYVLIQFGLITFYHLFFELMWNGQTPGKRRAGIRVVQSTGLPLTTNGVIIRNLVRLFDFLPFFYGVGIIVLFTTRNTQRLGDLAARTIVIRERKQLTLNTVREDLTVKYEHLRATVPIPHYVQIDHLSSEDQRTIVNFLRRRAALNNRDHLAVMLARQMLQKMNLGQLRGYVYESSITANGRQAELFLEQIARAFEVFKTEDTGHDLPAHPGRPTT